MLGSLLESLQIDVAFLQETHFGSCYEARSFEQRISVKGYFSFGSTRARGAAIVFRNTFRGQVARHCFDYEGRVVSVDVSVNGKDIRLVSVYAPTDHQERNEFFRGLDPYLMGKRDILVGGDFNCVLDDVRDRVGGTPRHQPWKAKELRRLLRATNLTDAWNQLHGVTPGFTFCFRERQVRLDRFYVTQTVSPILVDCAVVQVGTSANFFSDHRALVLETRDQQGFGLQPTPWRLNLSLLEEERG
ncbi:uncharacterized protein LOC135389501 [Ornithodoros turicata]|uniref:uncharacterized protein LOC135389501 n=1 Tax=Ornithodoros turicata TaxID=34597 RepID=UPI0031392FDC